MCIVCERNCWRSGGEWNCDATDAEFELAMEPHTGPTIITDFPGRAVEQHLRITGRLPCETVPPLSVREDAPKENG